MPYFRNHSVQDSIRQEPWVFGEDTTEIVKKYIKLRYKWLPYLYSLFHESSQTGVPIVRPLVMEYPEDETTFNISDQFLLGSNVMIAPILRPGTTHRSIYLPEGVWYDYWTKESYQGGKYVLIEAALDKLPIFIKEGTILPMGSEVQNTTENQILEIEVYAGDKGKFSLYEDDGSSLGYKDGHYSITNFQTEMNEGYLKVNVNISGDKQWKSQVKGMKVYGYSGDVRVENLTEVREPEKWKIEIL
ncbi:DUF5110 domain-containing protein [Mesobacillus subterraneus]|nr:TIM-barrel domain-containing protein [Mesobacillus subterraneus]MCM3576442.1 DUF5110 domain-containing protein [Mesobacillus subterraneus]